MKNDRTLAVVCVTAGALLSGCFGGPAHKVRSDVQSRAETQLMRGIRADVKGDPLEAERLLTDSLRLSASIEDNPAKALACINLARLYRLQHNPAQARESIDRALALLETGSDFYAEAAQEKALIELPADSASALAWAQKAVAAEKGVLLGRRLNLLGRIQMARGDAASAALTLKQGLDRNRADGQAEEEANSLRMLGILAREQQRVTEAERLLTEALEIDKRIGVSAKVATDLKELASTARGAGDLARAASHLERAYDVHLSAGRLQLAAGTQTALAEIYTSLGDKQRSETALKTARELADRVKMRQPAKPPAPGTPFSTP